MSLFWFEQLTEAQQEWLAVSGSYRDVEAGEVYRQGDPAVSCFVLLEGEAVLSRSVDGAAPESERPPGDPMAEAVRPHTGHSGTRVYAGSLRALTPCRFLVLPTEKLMSLLPHRSPRELPASSGSEDHVPLAQTTSVLRHSLRRNRAMLMTLAVAHCRSSELVSLLRLQDEAVGRVSGATELRASEVVARQDELLRWFEAYDVTEGWDLAPSFVRGGLGVGFLDEVLRRTSDDVVDDALHWLGYAVEAELSMRLVEDCSERDPDARYGSATRSRAP